MPVVDGKIFKLIKSKSCTVKEDIQSITDETLVEDLGAPSLGTIIISETPEFILMRWSKDLTEKDVIYLASKLMHHVLHQGV